MKTAFHRFIVPAALAVLVSAAPALAQAKSGGTKDSRRLFYLTKFIHYGDQTLQACEAGFHMASIWELLDLATMRYDATRGFATEDAGHGPPATMRGWVRTGSFAWNAGGTGYANCSAWTDAGFTGQGSMARLSQNWTAASTVVGPWVTSVQYCSEPERVWCVQD